MPAAAQLIPAFPLPQQRLIPHLPQQARVLLRPQQPRAQHQLIQTPALRLYLLAARPEPAHGTALAHGQAPQPQRTPAPGAAAVRGERTHGRVAAAGPGN